MFYAQEVACESIEFLIENDEHDWCDSKTVLVCNYYEKGKFTIEDSEIAGYNCENAQAFMPLYNLYENWAYQNALDGDVDIETNLPIFKRYVQMTLEGKMFFGVQISKIESVTLELGWYITYVKSTSAFHLGFWNRVAIKNKQVHLVRCEIVTH